MTAVIFDCPILLCMHSIMVDFNVKEYFDDIIKDSLEHSSQIDLDARTIDRDIKLIYVKYGFPDIEFIEVAREIENDLDISFDLSMEFQGYTLVHNSIEFCGHCGTGFNEEEQKVRNVLIEITEDNKVCGNCYMNG